MVPVRYRILHVAELLNVCTEFERLNESLLAASQPALRRLEKSQQRPIAALHLTGPAALVGGFRRREMLKRVLVNIQDIGQLEQKDSLGSGTKGLLVTLLS